MQRLLFIDWARGFAVVAMVLWHTGDAWLKPGLHAGEGFLFLRFTGGLAAPSFLLLAGLAAALSSRAHSDPEKALQTFRNSAARGLEIILVGYALRLQSWLIDASAVRQLHTARAWLPIAAGYLTLYFACKQLARQPRRGLRRSILGLVLVVTGMVQVNAVAAGRLSRLLQVDVLQAIGASLFLLALLQRTLSLYQRPMALALLATAIALLTAPIAGQLPGALPVPVAAYLGKFEAYPGGPQASLFPLLPWFAYACAGAALGGTWRRSEAPHERYVLWSAVLAASIACLASESHSLTRGLVEALPTTGTLLRVSYRSGLVIVLLGIAYAFENGRIARVLITFGRTSLRVYWAHMLFAYGIFGQPLRGRCGYLQWAVLAIALLALMFGLSRLTAARDRT